MDEKLPDGMSVPQPHKPVLEDGKGQFVGNAFMVLDEHVHFDIPDVVVPTRVEPVQPASISIEGHPARQFSHPPEEFELYKSASVAREIEMGSKIFDLEQQVERLTKELDSAQRAASVYADALVKIRELVLRVR